MYEITKMPSSIDIGFTGEKLFREIQIDMTKWMEEMPEGVPSIVYIRPGDTPNDAYIPTTTFANNILTWNIEQDDLGGIEGSGVMQVWLEETENTTLVKRGKSAVVTVRVNGSITDPGDTDPPARTMLLNLEAEAEGLPAGSDPTAEWEHEGYYGDYTLKLGIPKGDKGDKGDQGDPAPAEQVTTAVDAYLAENFSNPSNPPLDRTLASSSSAAPADMVGSLKSAIEHSIVQNNNIDFSGMSSINRTISSGNKWVTTNNAQGYMIAVENTKVISVKANSTSEARVSLLKTNDTTINAVPNYATGYSNYIVIPAGNTQTIVLPNDCTYIFVQKTTGSPAVNRLPESLVFINYKVVPIVDNTLSVSGDAADAKETGDRIANLNQYFDVSTNLVNPDTISAGMVIGSDGTISSSNQTDTSDYIEVEPGEIYYWKNLKYVCRYGSDKSWIGRTSATDQDHITLASTVYYVRVCGDTGTAVDWRFSKKPLCDKPYHEEAYLQNVDISPLVKPMIDSELKQSGVSTSKLFENGYLAIDSGNENDSNARLRTINYIDKRVISVKPKTGYEMAIYGFQDDQYKGNWKNTYFSKSGTALWYTGSVNLKNIGNYDFRLTFRDASDDTTELSPEANGDILEYVEYVFEVDNSENVIDQVMFSQSIDKVFGLSESPAWTGTAQTMTSAQVYSLFDELVTNNTGYLTKTELGDDEWGNEMAIYNAVPVQPNASYPTKMPKVFVNCGIHGYEHVPPIVLYLFIKALCEDWNSDPLLNVLRHEVEIHVIPVANPSGFNAYTRKNANGIDLNRNFEAGFKADADPSATDYSGTTALSEKETQYIYNWLKNNKDTDLAIDFHNFGAFSGNNIDWITIKTQYQAHIARTLIQRMTQKFKPEYSWLPQGVNNYYGYTSGVLSYNGLVKDQASAFGIPLAYTFEVPRSFWGTITDGATDEEHASMAPIHRKICIECFANFLLINLDRIEKDYKLI